MKPDVVLFGEMLPEQAMEDAHALCAGADLLLCVGTSLEVYPVAGLPEVTRAHGRIDRDRHDGPDAVRLARRTCGWRATWSTSSRRCCAAL